MRVVIFVLSVFSINMALADVPLPTYLPELRGLVVDSLTERSTFALNPGKLNKCERKVVVDWVMYSCSVDGASATSTDSQGKVQNFAFNEVHVTFRYSKEYGQFSEYIFNGDWYEKADPVALSSKVMLILWHPRSQPGLIRGSITLKDYSLTRAVHATR